MKKILLIGLCCFDVVNVASSYPEEDSDNVAQLQFIRRGGNASNSSTCLCALLKWRHNKRTGDEDASDRYSVEFFGTMSGNCIAQFMLDDMKACDVVHDKIVVYPNSVPVTAVITINAQNGSRTIIHKNNNLPELTADDFKNAYGANFSQFKWIHSELRHNVSDTIEMVRHIRKSDASGDIVVSLEVEGVRENGERALDEDIDYFFVSKDYIHSRGGRDVHQSVRIMSELLKKRDKVINLIVPWGNVGAMSAQIRDGKIINETFSPSVAPRHGKVVDTCGAGDSFIAGFIFASAVQKLSLGEATQFACRFAGAKCGTYGNAGLEEFEQFL